MGAAMSVEEQSTDPPPFPADVEAEILLRLPVKTLIRFKCACKSWYSLISSPQFQKNHFRRAQNKPPLLLTLHIQHGFYGEESTLHFSSVENNENGSLTLVDNFSKTITRPCHTPFMQSCLGLVCVSRGRYWNEPTLICNPSTQEVIPLPQPTNGIHVCIGFGFAVSTQQFKVVAFFSGKDNQYFEVFTLGTSHWRKGKSPTCRVDSGFVPFDSSIVPFLHEAFHFLPRVFYTGVQPTDRITVFDIDTEDFREAIPLPAFYYSLGDCEGHGILHTKDFLRLSMLGGSLCLTFDFGRRRYSLELWLLKDYNNAEWVKGYTIDVSSIFPYPGYSFWAYPVDTMADTILLNCSDDEGVKLLGYDPRDGTLSLKKDKEWAATFYVETFHPLRST